MVDAASDATGAILVLTRAEYDVRMRSRLLATWRVLKRNYPFKVTGVPEERDEPYVGSEGGERRARRRLARRGTRGRRGARRVTMQDAEDALLNAELSFAAGLA